MCRAALAALLLLLVANVASAQVPEASAAPVSAGLRAADNGGFGEVPWGTNIVGLHRAWPRLKKFYPVAKVKKSIANGDIVVLETKVSFKGKDYDARLFLDATGLFRVTLEFSAVEVPGQADTLDKLLDPIVGDLSTPDEDLPEHRIWRGAVSVVSATRTQHVGSFRVEVSFHRKDAFRSETSGGSLGID